MTSGAPSSEVIGRRVRVSGSVTVWEARPGALRYVWSVQVRGQGRHELVYEHHYLDRAFKLPPGQTGKTASFADQLELPPGNYRVWLYLYALQPGFDLAKSPPGADLRRKVWGR
jgi:hypothetical protein